MHPVLPKLVERRVPPRPSVIRSTRSRWGRPASVETCPEGEKFLIALVVACRKVGRMRVLREALVYANNYVYPSAMGIDNCISKKEVIMARTGRGKI